MMNVTRPTFNFKVIQRTLLNNSKASMFSSTQECFLPNNRHEARRSITRNEFAMHLDRYDSKKEKDLKEYHESKQKRLGGTFKLSYSNHKNKKELKTLEYEQSRFY
jgi:hypothetical protein